MSALVVVVATSACATSYVPGANDAEGRYAPAPAPTMTKNVAAPVAVPVASYEPIPLIERLEPFPPAATATEIHNCFLEAQVGVGKYEHQTDGSNFDGDADALYTRFRTEYVTHHGLGGGLSIEGAGSDDDLFEDAGVNDAQGGYGDIQLYFVGVPVNNDCFRLPIRVGPYLRDTVIDDDSNDSEIEWRALGLRVGAEPEFWIIQHEHFAFGLVGEANFGMHGTRVDVDSTTGDERFDGDGITYGFDAGVQALFGDHVTARLAWVYRRTDEDETDDENGIVVREMSAWFNGIVLGVGVRF